MAFMDQFVTPATKSGTVKVSDNPKLALLTQIEKQKKTASWVREALNAVAPKPSNRVWSSDKTGKDKVNKLVMGNDIGVDFNDPAQYAKWLDEFAAAVKSGELDNQIEWWLTEGNLK